MTGLLITCDIFNMPNNKKNVSYLSHVSPQKKDALRAISNTHNMCWCAGKTLSAPTPHNSNKCQLGPYTHSIRLFLYQVHNHTGHQQYRLKPQEPPELTIYFN